jgi:hypothetical protein
VNQGIFCFTKVYVRAFLRENVVDQEGKRAFTKNIVEATETASSFFHYLVKLVKFKASSPKSIRSFSL